MTPFEKEIESRFYSAMSGTSSVDEFKTPTAGDFIESIRKCIDRIPEPVPRFFETEMMVDTSEDWSGVRSPSRAARRRRQGHPQRIRYINTPKSEAYQIGDRVYVHPITLRRALAR